MNQNKDVDMEKEEMDMVNEEKFYALKHLLDHMPSEMSIEDKVLQAARHLFNAFNYHSRLDRVGRARYDASIKDDEDVDKEIREAIVDHILNYGAPISSLLSLSSLAEDDHVKDLARAFALGRDQSQQCINQQQGELLQQFLPAIDRAIEEAVMKAQEATAAKGFLKDVAKQFLCRYEMKMHLQADEVLAAMPALLDVYEELMTHGKESKETGRWLGLVGGV